MIMKWVSSNQVHVMKHQLYQDMIKLTRGGVSHKGLRIDARVKIPGCPELWIDHGNTHATKLNTFKTTYDFAIKVHKAAINTNGVLGASNACFHQSTPGVEQMRQSKNSTYEPLIALANDMNKKGYRTESPTFSFSLLS
jgi:hypothetical protein